MYNKSVNFILVIIGLFACTTNGQTGPRHNKTVVCYISTWAVYRPEAGSFSLDNFDPNLCTIAIYAFAGLDVQNDGIRSLDPWQDLEDDGGKGGYKKLTAFKTSHKHLKVLLAIGGWNEGSRNYSELAGDPNRRKRFVKQASEFVRRFNFDGLDLDWEYPTQRNGLPQDKESFVLLVKELSVEFKKYNFYLSSAFGASKKIIDSAYNVKALAPYLDSMHIMCYDYYGSWDKRVGLNAPLENDEDLNVKFSIDYFLKLGAPAEKLMLGLPAYGRTFLANNNGDMGDETDDQGFSGPYTRENGFMGYNEICQALTKNPEWKSQWHAESSEAIAKTKLDNETVVRVVSYDSPRSFANKVRYAIRKGLGGLMVWSIDTDDFSGECDDSVNFDKFNDYRTKPKIKLNFPKSAERNYPLLRTLNQAVIISMDELRQEEMLIKENEISSGQNNIGGGSSSSSSDHTGSNKNKNSSTAIAFSLFNVLVVLIPLRML